MRRRLQAAEEGTASSGRAGQRLQCVGIPTASPSPLPSVEAHNQMHLRNKMTDYTQSALTRP